MSFLFLHADFVCSIHVCDLPSRFDALTAELKGTFHAYDITRCLCDKTDSGLNVLQTGHLVSRISDFIIYSVEAEFINAVVKEFGPCPSLLFFAL